MRVLLVKLTSMGDLIHALPALTDAKRAIPDISFDWVIEKSFSEVAQWHPAVSQVIPTSHRKWRKNIYQSFKNGEIPKFFKAIRREKYDLIIDGQTSIKSAVTTLLAKGIRCGLDKNSARESIAALAYQRKYFVDKKLHAVDRLRLLFSQALNYSYINNNKNNQADYGIASFDFPALKSELQAALEKPYVVFVHNASWQSKLWPESYWHELISIAEKNNLQVLLPWGNAQEEQRAQRLIKGHANAQVLPFCSLSEQAQILKNAVGAISCDTGLAHLAAALNVPAVCMYGPTSVSLIGTVGLHQVHALSPLDCTQCYKHQCDYAKRIYTESVCLSTIKPQVLWQQLQTLLRR